MFFALVIFKNWQLATSSESNHGHKTRHLWPLDPHFSQKSLGKQLNLSKYEVFQQQLIFSRNIFVADVTQPFTKNLMCARRTHARRLVALLRFHMLYFHSNKDMVIEIIVLRRVPMQDFNRMFWIFGDISEIPWAWARITNFRKGHLASMKNPRV